MVDVLPYVSLVIPVYNGEKYLGEAIDSVLAQDYQPLELIVVDDGSVDKTAEIAGSYPQVNYLFQPNQNVSVARNTGIAAASGEFITFLDHDDLLLPDALTTRVVHLLEHPETMCVLAMHRSFLDEGVERPHWLAEIELREDRCGFGYLMARRTFFEQVGGFNAEYDVMENMELFSRAANAGCRIDKLDDLVVRRRVHEHNISGDMEAGRRNLLQVARHRTATRRKDPDSRATVI
ncbi:MAG: glycosyltransferase family 2 protein [Lentisphaerae bacterium]|nr:glycosyltransferase family 2 protein [Lentisphaerota bacterium]